MLSKQLALITGATSGIGLATAVRFSQLGARLALAGRNVQVLREHPALKDALIVPSDLSVESDVQRLHEQVNEHFNGKLNVLVNCAGVLERGSIESTSLEQYDRVMCINVRSLYQT